MTKEKLYNEAVKLWGINAQLDMSIEECSELIQAIQKYKRNGSLLNVYEEVADVELMCEQIRQMFRCDAPIERVKTIKLARLQELIKKGSLIRTSESPIVAAGK